MENKSLRKTKLGKVLLLATVGARASLLACLWIWSAQAASAQSFFASLIVDPVVGADRGSASQIQELDEAASFLTFSTTGSREAGRAVVGYAFGLPDFALSGDQFDAVALWAGPSEDGWRELLAGGVAYRFALASPDTLGFVNVDYGDVVLGTPETLALDVKGDRLQVAAGATRKLRLGETAEFSFGAEIIARDIRSSVLGTTVIDERLRMLRASVLYSDGIPLLFQKRFAASVTKGIPSFGASPEVNPQASVPGATSDFLRVSFAAEASVPLSRDWVINAGLIGQWTTDSLPASQRCGFETNSYARGFDYAVVAGDRCLGSRTELAYNIELPRPDADRQVFTQGFVGIDVGRFENLANVVSPQVLDTWSSLSAGIRSLRGNFLGEIAATRILDRPSVAAGQDENRIWVRAAYKF